MWPFRRRTDDDFRREIEAHIALEIERLVAEGLSLDEARHVAARTFGNVTATRERFYESRRVLWLDELLQDARYTLRTWRRSPGLAVVAVVTLALGIGANTAIFSLVEAVLLRTIPVTAPHELFFVAHGPRENPRTMSNYPLFERVAGLTDVFGGVAAYTEGDAFKVLNGDTFEMTPGQFVSGSYHRVLGVPMALGRGFTAEDDRPGSGAFASVISHAYWTQYFARDPDVLGRTLLVDGRVVSIVGVTAQGFEGLQSGRPRHITLPLALRELDDPGFFARYDNWTSMPLVVRLKPGVSEAQAASAVENTFHQFLLEPPNQWYRAPGGRIPAALLAPAARGSETLRFQYARALTALMAIAGLVLLIACINVASLLLARGAARTREFAIRTSVGAGRLRLARQSFTESALLACAGGGVGLALGIWSADALAAFFDSGASPVQLDVRPNILVLAFCASASAVAAIVFGVVPALAALRVPPNAALKEGNSPGRRRAWHAREVLVAGQIGLCVLLVTAAGLFVRTLHNLQGRTSGFNHDNVLVASLNGRGMPLPGGGPFVPPASSPLTDMCEQLMERLQARPGVIATSCSYSVPADTRGNARGVQLPGAPADPDDIVWVTPATHGYFQTFEVPLLRGRVLTARDSAASPPVAVISETTARHFFGDRDPVGRTLQWRGRPGEDVTIVGVVRDTVQNSFRNAPLQMAYIPLRQDDLAVSPSLYAALRTSSDPRGLAQSIRADVRALNGDIVVDSVRTMDAQIGAMLVRERVIAALSTAFGALAIVLACVGLYGVMSCEVRRRVRDIGIRLALGARPAMVLSEVLRRTALVCTAGVTLGVVAAVSTTRVLTGLLYGVPPRDPFTLTAAAVLLGLVSLAAGYLPARRAARIDPLIALRTE